MTDPQLPATTTDADRVALLRTVAGAPDPLPLEAIHALMQRPRRAASILPALGGLIADGLIERVAPTPALDSSNTGRGRNRMRADRPSGPVRFRMTEAGHALLAAMPAPAAAIGDGEDDGGDGIA